MEDNYPKNYYSKKSLWKWILLYVVIGIVAYGLIYYFFFAKNGGYSDNSQYPISNSQTQNNLDQTADWKTYTSTQYGFEFRYPKGVDVKENDDVLIIYDTRQGWTFEWSMQLYRNSKKSNLNDWINFQFSSFNQESDKDCKIVPSDKHGSRVTIKNAYTVLVDAPSFEASCCHVAYYTISPDNLTVIKFNLVQASPELFKDLLSTFKFTK